MYVYVLWLITLCDPHRWLAAVGPSALNRAAAVLFAPLLVLVPLSFPGMVHTSPRLTLYPPFLLYVGLSALSGVLAFNRPMAYDIFQTLALYYLLAVATLVYVRTPVQAVPILMLFLLQYLWWGVFAGKSGLVAWHPHLANTDGFGGISALGLGLCFWLGMALKAKWLRRLAFALAAYCVLGVVSAFARGAIFAAMGVALFVWLRSPRKLVTGGALVGGAVVFVAASALLHPGGGLWRELESAFTEGTESGTGLHRWELWKLAYRVFLERPILGVGGANFGPFASTIIAPEELSLFPNPAVLWAQNLHSVYFQVLSEFGFVGVMLLAWLILDFFKRNRALRRDDRVQIWTLATNGRIDLRYASYALEAAMVANLMCGALYASAYVPWTYTLLAANAMLFAVTEPRREPVLTRRPVPAELHGVPRSLASARRG
jgi:hypothetical protein